MGMGIIFFIYDLVYGFIKEENILGFRICMMVVWFLLKVNVRDFY